MYIAVAAYPAHGGVDLHDNTGGLMRDMVARFLRAIADQLAPPRKTTVHVHVNAASRGDEVVRAVREHLRRGGRL